MAVADGKYIVETSRGQRIVIVAKGKPVMNHDDILFWIELYDICGAPRKDYAYPERIEEYLKDFDAYEGFSLKAGPCGDFLLVNLSDGEYGAPEYKLFPLPDKISAETSKTEVKLDTAVKFIGQPTAAGAATTS
jgi:hypothetical protein